MRILVAATLVLVGVMSYAYSDMTSPNPTSSSVEIGLAELSPRGEVGGYAVPASGCSNQPAIPPATHSHTVPEPGCSGPTIDADKLIIVPGDDVKVTWTTGGWFNCVLSNQFTVTDTGTDLSGSEDFTITNENTYSIDCGAGGSDSVPVYILPILEET